MVVKEVGIKAVFSQEGLATFKKNINGWNAAMSAPLSRMKEVQTAQGGWNKRTKEGSTRLGRAALGFRKASHGMRGFRMEMLGVMFFGMALQRMFGGMMKTALEWTGIMDLLSMTLGVVFLPVALQLLEAFIPIATWFMNLSDTTKLWIGWIVVLGFVIGTVIMVIGQMTLGIGSLILAFGGFSVAGILAGLWSLAVVALAVVGAFFVLKGALGGFDEKFDKSVAKWQQNGGMFAKIVGAMVRILTLGGAIMSATLANAADLMAIAINEMAKFISPAIVGIINLLITAWNWIKKVAARGGDYEITAKIKAAPEAFDTLIEQRKKAIADRSVDLLLNTPTLNNLLTGGPATPEKPDGTIKTGAPAGGETNITNNFNGNTNEELKKIVDESNTTMASLLEAVG